MIRRAFLKAMTCLPLGLKAASDLVEQPETAAEPEGESLDSFFDKYHRAEPFVAESRICASQAVVVGESLLARGVTVAIRQHMQRIFDRRGKETGCIPNGRCEVLFSFDMLAGELEDMTKFIADRCQIEGRRPAMWLSFPDAPADNVEIERPLLTSIGSCMSAGGVEVANNVHGMGVATRVL